METIIMAEMMMSKKLVVLQRVDTVENIAKACIAGHHSFPVVNASGNLIGMIPSNFLIVIIKNRGFYFNNQDTNRNVEEMKASFGPHLINMIEDNR